jgi:Tol biopolymer transport system component
VRKSYSGVFTMLATITLLCVVAGSSGAAGGDTTLVSVADSSGTQADRESSDSSISPDGRFVAFASNATNLVTGDTNKAYDIFVRDRQTGTTERVSVSSSGIQQTELTTNNFGEARPTISSDGRFVAFASSSTKLVPNDTNGYRDIFVRDRQTGTTERVSVSSSGAQATGGFPGTTEPSGSYGPSISSDGRYVAFTSHATNLVSNDTNNAGDIFVRDRQEGTTERVNVDSSETQTSHSDSSQPSITSDGRYVAFSSPSPNLVANDTNNVGDVFMRDRQEGTTERVSVNSSGAQANDWSSSWGDDPSISSDGRFVAFTSEATNLVLGDTNNAIDIFVRDRQAEITRRVSVSSSGTQANGRTDYPSISPDGRFVAFESAAVQGATNLVKNDTNLSKDIFVRDQQQGTTRRVSVDSSGAQADSFSARPSISSDGRFVAFVSGATNLVASDANNTYDIFVHELGTIADTGTPMVDWVVPAKRATGVSRDANLTATFSEEMRPTSINTSSFELYQWNRKTKSWRQITDVQVSCESPCLEATLNPYPTADDTRLLAANKEFRAVLTTRVKDAAGNPLLRPFIWTFTTGSS